MFVAVFLRNGECHIVSYYSGFGNYMTFCDKAIGKRKRVNTLSLDNTFPGMCELCKSYYDSMHQDELNHFPNLVRKPYFQDYKLIPFYHRNNLRGPVAKFSDLMERNWYRGNRYQRIVDNPKRYRKPL